MYLLYRCLGWTSIRYVRSNREIGNEEQGVNADRWWDFPGGKHWKLIKNHMMCERCDWGSLFLKALESVISKRLFCHAPGEDENSWKGKWWREI